MSKPIDVKVKTHKPNHLASRSEKQAFAGAVIPKPFVKQFEQLATLNNLAKSLLSPVLGDEIALACQVVLSRDDVLTIALPTLTAVNHARFIHQMCLDALHTHEAFFVYRQIRFVCAKKRELPHQRERTKKPLSENTKRTITQYADIVITDKKLLASVHRLMNDAKVVDDDNND